MAYRCALNSIVPRNWALSRLEGPVSPRINARVVSLPQLVRELAGPGLQSARIKFTPSSLLPESLEVDLRPGFFVAVVFSSRWLRIVHTLMALTLPGSASGGRVERTVWKVEQKNKTLLSPCGYVNTRSVEGCWCQPVLWICSQGRLGPCSSSWLFFSFARHTCCTTLLRMFSSCAPADRAVFTRRVGYSHMQLTALGLAGMCESAYLHRLSICEFFDGCFEER